MSKQRPNRPPSTRPLPGPADFAPASDVPLITPTSYVIGITNACNLRCPLCVTGKLEQQKPVKMMELSLFKRIIDKIKDHATFVQLFKWGESLLHKDIIPMLEYCDRYDLNTEISSNLNIEDDAVLEALVTHRLKRLIVSLDGIDQEDYARYRVGGSAALVIANIGKLRDFKKKHGSSYPEIRIQYIRSKFTTNQPELIEANLAAWGADSAYVCDMTMEFKNHDYQQALNWFTPEEIAERRFMDLPPEWHGKRCAFLDDWLIIEQDGSIPGCCYATDPADDFGWWDDNRTVAELFTSVRRAQAQKMFDTKTALPGHPCTDCSAFITWVDPSLSGRPYVSPGSMPSIAAIQVGIVAENSLMRKIRER